MLTVEDPIRFTIINGNDVDEVDDFDAKETMWRIILDNRRTSFEISDTVDGHATITCL